MEEEREKRLESLFEAETEVISLSAMIRIESLSRSSVSVLAPVLADMVTHAGLEPLSSANSCRAGAGAASPLAMQSSTRACLQGHPGPPASSG